MEQFTALKRKALEKYFSRMNDQQRKAVFKIKGPLLILAGAGSGKTTVLVNRIANMIYFGNALHNSSFSRHMAHKLCYFISLHITSSDYTTDLPVVHLPRLYRSFHSRLVLSTCVPTVLIMRGTGI